VPSLATTVLSSQRQRSSNIDLVDPRPPKMFLERPSSPHAGDHTLADQVALELREHRDHPEQRSAAGGRRVDCLVEDNQLYAKSPKLLIERHEMPDRARAPIELCANHHVRRPPPDSLQERVEAWATLPGPAHAVINVLGHLPTARCRERTKRHELILRLLFGR
jgi:hypothetical protein